jgi:dTDP-4-amino-4,6-dideoxygalactose transaminase
MSAIPSIDCPVELSSDHSIAPTQPSVANDLVRHVYHQYTIAVEGRDLVVSKLTASKIGCAIYYPVPLHLQKVNEDLSYARGDFPSAERVSSRCLSLPMYPELSAEQQQHVIDGLQRTIGACVALAAAA